MMIVKVMKTISRSNSHKFKAPLVALTMALSLSACSSNFLVGDAVSTIATDKTIGDHVVSLIARKDCSIVRQQQGLSYCKEDAPDPTKAPKMHCYRELGTVTCYEEEDVTSIRPSVEDMKMPQSKKWKPY
ncbi:hypothetical protein [Terasakiella pusilla]|uniref:hypothetical protein n=1 Tax=Terasakiella pusilla TaxID=64973 RepID=UPI003AA88DFD